MIDRYRPPQIRDLFGEDAQLGRWLEIELAVLAAQEALGNAPVGSAARARAKLPVADTALVNEVRVRQRVTEHQIAAFVDVVSARLGPEGAWFHAGLTSADIRDSGNGLMLKRACDVLSRELGALHTAVVTLAERHTGTPIMGRTHGMWAEPTTFGAKVVTWALRLERDAERLRAAQDLVAVGEVSGPVGIYSNIDPRVEELVCQALGLGRSFNGQFVSRDRFAQYVWACANISTTIEAIATQVRLLHASEVGEVHESFAGGQKGSSSMPHKRNPLVSQELCGLARVVRGYLVTSMESTVAWHEGDTTSLSVESVVLPDVSNLTCFSIGQARQLIESLDIDTVSMLQKFDDSRGLPFSAALMQVLIDSGLTREDAYRAVQRAAALTHEDHVGLEQAFLRGSPGLDPLAVKEAFSLERALRNVPVIIDALGASAPDDQRPSVG